MRIEPISQLPAGWNQSSLRQIVTRVTRRNVVGNNNVLTISAKDGIVGQEGYFSRRVASADIRNYYLLEPGDFAYNKSYSVGFPVGVIRRLDAKRSGVVSPLYICFRPRRSQHSDFLRYYFEAGMLDDAIAWIAKEGARNHGLLNVGLEDFLSLQVQLPPIGEQRQIALTLASIDAAIECTERCVAKLLAVRISAIGRLMGDFVKYAPSVQIKEIAIVFNGATPSRERPDYWGGGTIPWLASTKVNDRVVETPSETITRRAVRDYGLRIAPKGSIVVGMIGDGRTRGMSARLAIPATISQNLAAIVPTTRVNSPYLHLYLEFQYRDLRSGGRGSNQDALNTRLVGDFAVSLPSLEQQLLCSDATAVLDQAISSEKARLEKLLQLKKGLAMDLMTGRTRVKPGEEVPV